MGGGERDVFKCSIVGIFWGHFHKTITITTVIKKELSKERRFWSVGGYERDNLFPAYFTVDRLPLHKRENTAVANIAAFMKKVPGLEGR